MAFFNRGFRGSNEFTIDRAVSSFSLSLSLYKSRSSCPPPMSAYHFWIEQLGDTLQDSLIKRSDSYITTKIFAYRGPPSLSKDPFHSFSFSIFLFTLVDRLSDRQAITVAGRQATETLFKAATVSTSRPILFMGFVKFPKPDTCLKGPFFSITFVTKFLRLYI